MADTVERLILQVQGAEEIKLLKQAILDEEAALRKHIAAANDAKNADEALNAAVRQSAEDLLLFKQGLKNAEDELNAEANAMRDAAQAARDKAKADASAGAAADKAAKDQEKLAAASGRVKNGMAGSGQAMLQTGRIIQDFTQGGIGGILNNVEGLAQALGGGPGLAGALTALGVAAFVLGPHLKTLAASLGLFGDQSKVVKDEVAELEKQVEALEKNPAKLTIESEQLDEAKAKLKEVKEALAALEQARKTRSFFEKESGAQVTETLAEVPGGEKALVDRLVEAATARNIATDKGGHIAGAAQDKAEAERQIKLGQEMLAGAHSVEEAETLRAQVNAAQAARADAIERDAAARRAASQAANQAVGGAVGGATQGKADKQAALAQQLRGIGEHGLAAGIEASSPQKLEELDLIDYERQQGDERAKTVREEREKEKKKRDRAAKERRDAQEAADEASRRAQKQIDNKKKADEAAALNLQLNNAGEQDDARTKAAKDSGLVPRAAFLQAQLVNGNPENGIPGISPEAAQQQTAREADRFLALKYPDMPKEDRHDVARSVAQQGHDQAQREFTQQVGRTMDVTGGAMQETQMAMQRTLAVLAKATGQFEQLAGQARGLGQQADQIGNRMDNNRRSVLRPNGR